VPVVRRTQQQQAWPGSFSASTTTTTSTTLKNPDAIVCAAARKKDKNRRASVGAFGEQIDLEVDEEASAEQIAFLDNEITELQEQSANIESNEEDIEMMNKDIADKVKMLEALKHTIEEEMPKLKSHIEELTEQQNLQEIEREKLLGEIAKKEAELKQDLKGKTSEQAKMRLKALRDRLKEKEKEISSIAGKLSHSRRSVRSVRVRSARISIISLFMFLLCHSKKSLENQRSNAHSIVT
jgi:chromosome segregation ATPase